MTNTRDTIAVRTPMSRTRTARSANSAISSSGRPNSFTSVAPGAEKRSVIWLDRPALRSAASRRRSAMRLPMRRAGITKIGSSTSASSVTCHASVIITATASVSWMTLVTTLASVDVIADCAPITSLLSLLTSAPVRVRVKNATGIVCTCANTARRRSAMSPSPMLAENHRVPSPLTASTIASAAIPPASPITVAAATAELSRATIASTTRPARIGVMTPTTADTTVSIRNATRPRRYGAAKRQIRGIVPFLIERGASTPCVTLRSIPNGLSTRAPLRRPPCVGGATRALVPCFPGGPPPGRPAYFFFVRVAPPRPRSVTPVSESTRCTNP